MQSLKLGKQIHKRMCLCERVRTTVISWSLVSGELAAKRAEALWLYAKARRAQSEPFQDEAQSTSNFIAPIEAGATF